MLIFFGAALLLFVVATDEQSMLSSGSPSADKMSLHDLIAKGPGKNKHIELTDFYFGKQYIYATKMVQFNEVYVPMFARGEPETGNNLKFVLWIRNDRNSNQRLVQGQEDLDRFVRDFNQHPGSVTGILRQPIDRVRNLTLESYPGTNRESLQVLWARDFPSKDSTDLMWALCVGSLLMAAVCAYAYKRQSHSLRD